MSPSQLRANFYAFILFLISLQGIPIFLLLAITLLFSSMVIVPIIYGNKNDDGGENGK